MNCFIAARGKSKIEATGVSARTISNPSQTEHESEIFLQKGRMYRDVSVIDCHPKHPNKDKHSEADKKNPLMIRSRRNRRRPFIAILWGMATFKDGPQVKFLRTIPNQPGGLWMGSLENTKSSQQRIIS